MSKKCKNIVWQFAWILANDQFANSLIKQIDINTNWEWVFIKDWKIIQSEWNSKSAYNTLLSYARFKFVNSWTTKNQFVISLIDRMKSFWFDWNSYADVWEYVNRIESFSEVELAASWITNKYAIKIQDAVANKILLDFNYAAELDTIWKSVAWVSESKLISSIKAKNLDQELEKSFKEYSKKFWNNQRWYKKWLEKLFKDIYQRDQNITDWILQKLIDHSGTYNNFMSVMAYRYISSWRANFKTAFDILDNTALFESIERVPWWTYDWVWSIISYFKSNVSKKEKVAALWDFLLQAKSDKSFNSLSSVIDLSMMIDNLPIKSSSNINDFIKATMSNKLLTDKSSIDLFLSNLKWDKLIDDFWWVIDWIDQYPVHYFFWLDDSMMTSFVPLHDDMIRKFWIEYKNFQKEYYSKKVLEQWIDSTEKFQKMVKNTKDDFLDSLANNILEKKWKSSISDWVLAMSSNYDWDLITAGKKIVIVREPITYDGFVNNIKQTEISYETNYVQTLVKDHAEEIVILDSIDEIPKDYKWIIILQDKNKNLYNELSIKYSSSAILSPAGWIRFDLLNWDVVARFSDNAYMWRLYGWVLDMIWQWNLNANTKKNIKNMLINSISVDNQKTIIGIRKWTESWFAKEIQNYQKLVWITKVSATRWKILDISKWLLDNNRDSILNYIKWFVSKDDVQYLDWSRLTVNDIAHLLTSKTESSVDDVIRNISKKEWISPKIKNTDVSWFWSSFYKYAKKPYKIETQWDIIVYKNFIDFITKNDNVLDIISAELKKARSLTEINYTELKAWNKEIKKSVDNIIQDSINNIANLTDTGKDIILSFIEWIIKSDTSFWNRVSNIETIYTIANRKISLLSDQIDYYWDIVRKIKEEWYEIERWSDSFNSTLYYWEFNDIILDLNKQEDELSKITNDLLIEKDSNEVKIKWIDKELKDMWNTLLNKKERARKKELVLLRKQIERRNKVIDREFNKAWKQKDRVFDKQDKFQLKQSKSTTQSNEDFIINRSFVEGSIWTKQRFWKNYRSWLVGTILEDNARFDKTLTTIDFKWIKIKSDISSAIKKYSFAWKEWIDLQYEIFKLNNELKSIMNWYADKYWDLFRYISKWENYNDAFFKWISIDIDTSPQNIAKAIEDLKKSMWDKSKKIVEFITLRIEWKSAWKQKSLKTTLNNILDNWHSSVYHKGSFYSITIEDWIMELLAKVWDDESKYLLERFKNYDIRDLKAYDKKFLFSNLYAKYFGNLKLNTAEMIMNKIWKDWWELFWDLVKDYWIVKYNDAGNVINLPNIITKSDFAEIHWTLAKVNTIFGKIRLFTTSNSMEEMTWIINKTIEDLYEWQSKIIIDDAKQIYSIYPKLISDKVLWSIVLWDYSKELDNLVTSNLDSIKAFEENASLFKQYAPSASIWWENVYWIKIPDSVSIDSFIPKNKINKEVKDIDKLNDKIIKDLWNKIDWRDIENLSPYTTC